MFKNFQTVSLDNKNVTRILLLILYLSRNYNEPLTFPFFRVSRKSDNPLFLYKKHFKGKNNLKVIYLDFKWNKV